MACLCDGHKSKTVMFLGMSLFECVSYFATLYINVSLFNFRYEILLFYTRGTIYLGGGPKTTQRHRCMRVRQRKKVDWHSGKRMARCVRSIQLKFHRSSIPLSFRPIRYTHTRRQIQGARDFNPKISSRHAKWKSGVKFRCKIDLLGISTSIHV